MLRGICLGVVLAVLACLPARAAEKAIDLLDVPVSYTADFTVTAEMSGLAVLTVTNESGSNTYYPRAGTVSTANAAALYAAGGTAVNDRIPVAQERVKIVVAQGGATKSGRFHVYIG